MNKRGSGILLHIPSLPSPFGIGDFGPSAYRFADFLNHTHQRYWQILPLGPTDAIYHNSPYHSISAFALNPLFVSPDLLVKDGLIKKIDFIPTKTFSNKKVHYDKVIPFKRAILKELCLQQTERKKTDDYEKFCAHNAEWLDDYALFAALHKHFKGKLWVQWPDDIRDKQRRAVGAWNKTLEREIGAEKYIQYILEKQWFSLKNYCNSNGVNIIGDIPIYVNYNSADVWVNPRLFKLDNNKKPYAVAGVPPDYFSDTGQLWGNPVYNWDKLKKSEYVWWIKRFKRVFSLYDIVRIDHFRGLVAYWEVPAKKKTAINGKWVDVPVRDFFNMALKKIKNFQVIAEDLGVITPDVIEVMNQYHFPGMKVLLFAFGGKIENNPYIPHNHVQNCIVYTGTHDTNTAKGWFEKEATYEEKKNLFRYLGRKISPKEVSWELIRMAMASIADTSIIPMQDILGLGQEARMNRPSVPDNNWEWRLSKIDIEKSLINRLKGWTKMYGRISG